MTAPMLTTKLFIPPIRLNLVPRPRLLERLDEGLRLGRKLTLVSAPAGFGKTTLVSAWVEARGSATPPIGVAWLSLDERDNDPTSFLAYFVAALRTVDVRRGHVGDIGKGALSALRSPQPPPIVVILTMLINEIAAIPDGIILVLDDYHMIQSPLVTEGLSFLLEHVPPQLHLVIATREDPQLPLARLRARGQLTELRAADLRFTSSEAAEFLNEVMGLDLSAENVGALENRTEGWIAGLQLAAISMQGHKDATSLVKSFTGSHRLVLDYLIEEVLNQQTESVQTFLLQTAILDRCTGSLCDAVTGQDNGRETLEMLENANLFIVRLDEERRWYRYHHLFADLLRQRLHQIQPQNVSALHHRASEWYEKNGFAFEAIEHTLRAEDFVRAAPLIEKHFDAMYQRGEHIRLRRWLTALPIEFVFSRPQLCILHAWDLFSSGQLDAAERSLQAVEQNLESSTVPATGRAPIEQDQLTGADRLQLHGRVAAMRAFLASYRGDVPGTIQYARQALEYLPEQEFTWRSTAAIALGDAYDIKGDMAAAYQARLDALQTSKLAGDIYLSMLANLKVAVTLRMQGQLQRVIQICQQQLEVAEESGISQTVAVGWLMAIWGEVLAELDDLEAAQDLATKGVELAERGRDVAMLGWSYVRLLRVLYSTGELAGAEEIIRQIEAFGREQDVPPWIKNQIEAWKVRIWLAQDKLDAASQWVHECGPDADGDPVVLRETECIALARILIAQGRLDKAAKLLRRLLAAAESGERTSSVIEILMLQALAFKAAGDTTQAAAVLERALTQAEPGGYVRIFVDEGPPMAGLLYEAVSRGIAPEYARRLLSAFPVAEPRQIGLSEKQAPKPVLVEPLSERELEVLQLIADGLTNQEIASRLFLSLNTVKVHTRNIYGKLDVHSRTQAVARSQELGLLPRS